MAAYSFWLLPLNYIFKNSEPSHFWPIAGWKVSNDSTNLCLTKIFAKPRHDLSIDNIAREVG